MFSTQNASRIFAPAGVSRRSKPAENDLRKQPALPGLGVSERITFYPRGAKRKGSGTTAYAWVVWDKKAPAATELKWFKPGYKAKFR